MTPIDLSILFVNYNSWALCADAVQSIIDTWPKTPGGERRSVEIIVVDNQSPLRDEAAEPRLESLLGQVDGRLIRHTENAGYSKGMNLAYAASQGERILVTNPDVVFTPGCLDTLIGRLDTMDDAGAIQPRTYVDRGMRCQLPPINDPTIPDLISRTLVAVSSRQVARYSRKRTAIALPIWEAKADIDLVQLSGCCFMMRRTTVEELGLFDERFPLYFEDTDLSVRLREAGRRLVMIGDAHLVHLYGRSGQTDQSEAMRRFWISGRAYFRKWYGRSGWLLFRLCEWFGNTGFAKRRSKRQPHADLIDLEPTIAPPTITFDRPMPHFLVEVAIDPRFYIAGGMFGSGETWRVPVSLLESFGPVTYYFRVCDLSGGDAKQVGVYRYVRPAG